MYDSFFIYNDFLSIFNAERTIIVSEYFGTPLSEQMHLVQDVRSILRICYQTADGLQHLHRRGFVCPNLEPANVLIDSLDNVRLFNYGLFHMTNGGEYVSFPIGYKLILYN